MPTGAPQGCVPDTNPACYVVPHPMHAHAHTVNLTDDKNESCAHERALFAREQDRRTKRSVCSLCDLHRLLLALFLSLSLSFPSPPRCVIKTG